jgi:hypothetical protein
MCIEARWRSTGIAGIALALLVLTSVSGCEEKNPVKPGDEVFSTTRFA